MAEETKFDNNDEMPDAARFKQMARELVTIRQLLLEVTKAIRDAETEVPEKMRRFVMYMHDVHDIAYMYEERGVPVPQYVARELERCDDRYRQLLQELHLDGGIFERVRSEMAKDPDNRWDHTRQLPKPTPRPEEPKA